MISYRKLAMRVLGHSPVSAVKTARRSTGKRAAALALTAALVVGMTLPAFALPWYIEDGDISISAGESGNDVTQNGETTKNDTDTVITNRDTSTASSNTVTINADEGKTVNVTLDNVNIDTSETGEAAVSVTGSGNTNIELNGNNTLTSGGWHAGLEHNKETDSEGNETSGTLTITDTDKNGSLAATGGNYGGAGIGGGNIEDAGKLEITGGTITATGGLDGAGIGGGGSGGDADITISGGTITAIGGTDPWQRPYAIGGAGIGSGGANGNSTVTITGDAVIKEAIGGNGCSGIGGGYAGECDVTISGDAVIEHAEGGVQSAGIGGGGWDTIGTVTIKDNAQINNSTGSAGAAGIGSGVHGDVTVTIEGNSTIDNATGGSDGAGIGGGYASLGDVTIEGNVTIKNAQGGAGAAGIGGGSDAETKDDGTGNRIVIRSNEDGSPTINATGGVPEVDDDGNVISAGGAAIGSGASLPDKNGDVAPEADADITIEGKVTINATGGGDVAIGDSINGETQFSGLQVGTTITRRNAKGDDVSQPGDVVREQAPTETEAAEAPSTGSVEVERPVTVEGLYVTNVLGKQITHTCTQNGTTLTIRANGIVASAHLTLGMVRTLKAQGVKTLVFTTLLSRSTTVSVDALLAAEPDAPDETAVVWTHTGPCAALTIDGADHSALLK